MVSAMNKWDLFSWLLLSSLETVSSAPLFWNVSSKCVPLDNHLVTFRTVSWLLLKCLDTVHQILSGRAMLMLSTTGLKPRYSVLFLDSKPISSEPNLLNVSHDRDQLVIMWNYKDNKIIFCEHGNNIPYHITVSVPSLNCITRVAKIPLSDLQYGI